MLFFLVVDEENWRSDIVVLRAQTISLLTNLANLSFNEGIFPDMFKLGQITPLLKSKGLSPDKAANYRPVTNLNTIGKILERLYLTRLKKHFNKFGHLFAHQSAYREFHSTESALIKIMNDLLLAADSGKLCLQALVSKSEEEASWGRSISLVTGSNWHLA